MLRCDFANDNFFRITFQFSTSAKDCSLLQNVQITRLANAFHLMVRTLGTVRTYNAFSTTVVQRSNKSTTYFKLPTCKNVSGSGAVSQFSLVISVYYHNPNIAASFQKSNVLKRRCTGLCAHSLWILCFLVPTS